jgi:c-di-GMP-specific phosphodiesterase
MFNDRWTWDPTTTLEALGAAMVALWLWEPATDRLSFTGPTRSLGLGPLAPECSGGALRALIQAEDRPALSELLQIRPPGAEIELRLRLLGGVDPCLWQGVWLEDGVRAAGIVRGLSPVAASRGSMALPACLIAGPSSRGRRNSSDPPGTASLWWRIWIGSGG